MARRLGTTLGSVVTAAILASSCQSDNLVSTDDLGAVLTVVDSGGGLHTARTFALPDTVIVREGSLSDPGPEADQAVVSRVRAHLIELGWIDVGTSRAALPDVVVLIAANSRVQTGIAYSDWFSSWGYLPYWGPGVTAGSAWSVPDGAIAFAFESGTVLITMLDVRLQRGDTADIPLLWAAALNGVVTDPSSTLTRALAGVDQAFVQSPYLRIQ